MGDKLFSRDILAAADSVTTTDMDIYVNAATGSDVTGNGTAALPYATITKAFEDVPYFIKHVVHIHVAAGTYTAFPELIEHRMGEGGALSLDGTAALVDVDAGPFTTDAGGAVVLTDTYIADNPVVGGGLTPSAWAGKLLLGLSGGIDGVIGGIIDNDATDVRINMGYCLPAAGETFKIVEPGVEVQVPGGQRVRIKVDSDAQFPMAIAGIKMTSSDQVDINAGYILTAASDLNLDALTLYNTVLYGGYYGTAIPAASILDLPGIVGSWGGGGVMSRPGTGLCTLYDSNLAQLVAIRPVDVGGGVASIDAMAIVSVGDYGIDAYSRVTYLRAWGTYVKAKSTKGALQVSICRNLDIVGFFVQEALAGIHVTEGAGGFVASLHGVDANVGNGMLVGNGSSVVVEASSCDLAGASGAGHEVKWESGAADSAYPAANNVITDALGAQVVGQ